MRDSGDVFRSVAEAKRKIALNIFPYTLVQFGIPSPVTQRREEKGPGSFVCACLSVSQFSSQRLLRMCTPGLQYGGKVQENLFPRPHRYCSKLGNFFRD